MKITKIMFDSKYSTETFIVKGTPTNKQLNQFIKKYEKVFCKGKKILDGWEIIDISDHKKLLTIDNVVKNMNTFYKQNGGFSDITNLTIYRGK